MVNRTATWQQIACCVLISIWFSVHAALLRAQEGQHWTQWRGPARDGQVSDGQSWPESLGEEQLVEMWQVPLGPSYSGPIVLGDYVYTTETKDEQREVAYAFNRKSGKELWETGWDGAMKVPFFANANGSWIRATPASDGKRLFVAGMRDVLVCLDIENGDELWQVDFVERYGTPLPAFGFASSPLVDGEHVYVQAGQSLVKLDAKTGESVWRTAINVASTMNSPFSSPILTKLAGRELLLLQTRTALKGIAPETGKELWSQEIVAFRGMNILTPTVYKDSIFTSAHSGRSQLWSILRDESGQEEAIEQWSHKSQAYMSSPVVVDDHLYMHLRNQRLLCLDLRTGEEKWRTRPFGKYWSMVASNEKILALDSRGKLYLFRANPEEFELLGEREVTGKSTWAHLAVAEGQVFVRSLDALLAYRWQ